jgi:MFS-type transporter involved in bile tolerance (Atg22 family)
MWQKPARGILQAKDTIGAFMGFAFFCVMNGMLGALAWVCFNKKAEWTDKVSFGFLAMSMSVFYGFLIFEIILARRRAEKNWLHSFVRYLKLAFFLAAFLIGFLVIQHS